MVSVRVIQAHPLDQSDLLQAVFSHLSITDVFKCAPVSKYWNKTTKRPTWHPTNGCLHVEISNRARARYQPLLDGRHINDNLEEYIDVESIPEERFIDLACVVKDAKFHIIIKDGDLSSLPKYITNWRLFSQIKCVSIELESSVFSLFDKIPYVDFIQKLLDNVGIVEFHMLIGINFDSIPYNFSKTRLANFRGSILIGGMERSFPNLTAINVSCSMTIPKLPPSVSVLVVENVRNHFWDQPMANMENMKLIVLGFLFEPPGLDEAAYIRDKLSELKNLQKVIVWKPKNFKWDFELISPKGVELEIQDWKFNRFLTRDQLLEIAIEYK